jgi:hypothetical protein
MDVLNFPIHQMYLTTLLIISQTVEHTEHIHTPTRLVNYISSIFITLRTASIWQTPTTRFRQLTPLNNLKLPASRDRVRSLGICPHIEVCIPGMLQRLSACQRSGNWTPDRL